MVQIKLNLIKHLTDLKHRHLAGAFFLALIPDNNFVLFEYLLALIVLKHMQYLYFEQIKMMRAYPLYHEKSFFWCLIPLIIRLIARNIDVHLHIHLTLNNVIAVHRCHVGSLNASLVHPRKVFKLAIHNIAASVIVAHQHPSDDIKPMDDIDITSKLVDSRK
ncbi:JAB domain-containing protein [Bacillaceae bacterium W0354]